MDFSLVIAFALLQCSLGPAGSQSAMKPSANEFQSCLEWKEVNPQDVKAGKLPPDVVNIFDKKSKKTLYIARSEDCKPCFYDIVSKQCSVSTLHAEFNLGHVVPITKLSFLVNKDNFEILEWKKSSYGEIPPLPVETCNGYFIAMNEFGPGFITANSLMSGGNTGSIENEVLTLNHDIKGQHLTIIKYDIKPETTSVNGQLLKSFVASNKNCEPAKQQVKLDQGIDKTISFLKTRTHAFGGTGEISVSGKIPLIVEGGGKLALKYDYTRLNSKTTSTVDKSLHSISMEVQVPPNQECRIDIKSITFTADVPYTGQLTRIYNNNEIRRTSITDTYSHQEVTQMQALVNPCTPLSDGKKC